LTFDFAALFSEIVPPGPSVGRFCAVLFWRFQHVHCGFRQALLIGGACVGFRHFERVPTEDRHELMRRRSVVGRNGRARFARPVRGAMVKACLVAPLAELISESGVRERPS
jgi:hypothetical protein